jgi:hypothetical protein
MSDGGERHPIALAILEAWRERHAQPMIAKRS